MENVVKKRQLNQNDAEQDHSKLRKTWWRQEYLRGEGAVDIIPFQGTNQTTLSLIEHHF